MTDPFPMLQRLVNETDPYVTLALIKEIKVMATQRAGLLEALEELLAVEPRPVKIPGTVMGLTVSYTEGDLRKMKEARLVATIARGES